MAKFKVGDKVRVVTHRASVPYGTELTVKRGPISYSHGGNYYFVESVAVVLGDDLEKVKQKQTKSQRIEALEKQVAELKLEIEALKPSEIAGQISKALREEKSKTPNQQRKAIIDEAKAFVEDVTKRVSQYGHGNKLGEHGEITTGARGWITKAEFVVNAKKRTVVALARGVYSGNIHAKGIAKCAPDDVFNEHIGKAIALGRALGLDVTRFEQAVQPTEVVVGQRVLCGEDSYPTARNGIYTVKSIPQTETEIGGVLVDAFNIDRGDGLTWVRLTELSVTDDTEAQY